MAISAISNGGTLPNHRKVQRITTAVNNLTRVCNRRYPDLGDVSSCFAGLLYEPRVTRICDTLDPTVIATLEPKADHYMTLSDAVRGLRRKQVAIWYPTGGDMTVVFTGGRRVRVVVCSNEDTATFPPQSTEGVFTWFESDPKSEYQIQSPVAGKRKRQ